MTLLLFQNPVIAIVPRVMVGIVAAAVFNLIAPKVKTGLGATVKLVAAGILGALTNTGLVIVFTWIFFASRATQVVAGADSANLGLLLMAAFGINAIAEAAMAGIVTPILGRVLLAVQARRR